MVKLKRVTNIITYLLLLAATEVFAKKPFLPHSSSTVTKRLPPTSLLHRSDIQQRNIVDESFDRDACNDVAFFDSRRCPDVGAIISIRGGGSSEPNTVQTIVKSILSSYALPEPIKFFIEMICQLLERITGFDILPSVETKSKAKKSKPIKKKRVPAKEVSVSAQKIKRTNKKILEDSIDEEVSLSEAEDEKFFPSEKKSVKRKKMKDKTHASYDCEVIANTEVTAEECLPKPNTSANTRLKQPPAKTDAASKKFLSNNMKSSNPNYRIQRELKEFLSSPPPGLSVKISGKNVRLWVITLSMPDNCIYAGEKYKLRVQFPSDYPTSPPSVFFLPPTPRHEHVYTNGDICLSLLGKDWRPIMTAQSIAQAIMSILCGAQRKSLPMDNARHAGNKPGQKQDDWVYHDDNC